MAKAFGMEMSQKYSDLVKPQDRIPDADPEEIKGRIKSGLGKLVKNG